MVIRPVKSSYYVFESTILSFFHHFNENVFESSISINVHIRNIRKLRRRSFRHVGRDYHQGSWDPHTSHSVIDSKYIIQSWKQRADSAIHNADRHNTNRHKRKRYITRRNIATRHTAWGGILPEKLGRGVRQASQNPYPIYDQNLRFSVSPFYDLTKNYPENYTLWGRTYLYCHIRDYPPGHNARRHNARSHYTEALRK